MIPQQNYTATYIQLPAKLLKVVENYKNNCEKKCKNFIHLAFFLSLSAASSPQQVRIFFIVYFPNIHTNTHTYLHGRLNGKIEKIRPSRWQPASPSAYLNRARCMPFNLSANYNKREISRYDSDNFRDIDSRFAPIPLETFVWNNHPTCRVIAIWSKCARVGEKQSVSGIIVAFKKNEPSSWVTIESQLRRSLLGGVSCCCYSGTTQWPCFHLRPLTTTTTTTLTMPTMGR